VNKIIVIGNLGRDPEMRYTPSGQAVTSFSVASSRRYRTADGEQREETEWFNVSAFGRLSEICNQYLTRGQQVYVEGRLRGRSYTDRDGQPRYSLEVTATEMQMLGRRGENEYGGGGGGGGGGYGDRESDGGGRGMADAGGPPPYDETDDLPF
jgi:single-strand DNA-binding protein